MRMNSKIKTVIALSIVAVGGVIAIYFAITVANNMERYGTPFFDAKVECAKQLENMVGYADPYSVGICAKMVENYHR